MLDLKFVAENAETVQKNLHNRGIKVSINKLVEAYAQHKLLLQEQDGLRAEKNTLAKSVKSAPSKAHIQKVKAVKHKLEQLEAKTKELPDLKALLTQLPNLTLPDVPVGKDASTNVVLREVGKKPKLTKAQAYLALGENLGIIDVERAAKVAGSRFGYLTGAGALLEFALVQYALQELTHAGFTPMVPPVLVKEQHMAAMGYLAQGGADEVYHLEKDKQYLVGTSEQSVGPYHADELIPQAELPKKYAAISTCFRREAGSYGKDTKGILRVHQFDKVEMFVVCVPEASEKIHQQLLTLQEKFMQGLQLPYRVVQLCTGELGFPSAKTIDIETWLPGQDAGKGEYRETHSTSNTTDYQARALNVRVKGKDGKNVVAHMLNGTAFAIGRTIIAILENYQQPDGSVKIPKVLVPFMHGLDSISVK